MSVKLQEGFDWLTSSSVLTQLGYAGYYYTTNESLITGGVTYSRRSDTAFGDGYAVRMNVDSIWDAERVGTIFPLDNTETELTFGIRLRIPSIFDQNGNRAAYIALWEGTTNNLPQLSLSFDTNGVIRLWRGTPNLGTLLGNTLMANWYYDTWFFIEIQALIANSGGYAEVRMNTETIISVSSIDTQALSTANVDSVFAGLYYEGENPPTDGYIDFDDIYASDLSGTVNNDFLGNVRTRTMTIVGDGDVIQMAIGGTSPAATNWQSVANTALDDTKYVKGDPTEYDLYDVNAILNSPLVRSLQLKAAMKMDDATQRTGTFKIKTNGTEYTNSQVHYVNQSYTFYWSRWEINPDTSAQFTGDEVNAIQAGILAG